MLRRHQQPRPAADPRRVESARRDFLVGERLVEKLEVQSPILSAASPRAPPLTREQWDALDRVYHAGGYGLHEEYRERLARRESLATLADLTPDERRIILASRGVLPVRHGLSVTMSHKVILIDTTGMVLYNLRGSPAVPIDLMTPDLPEALRRQPAQWTVVARLRVERDGSTTVELTGPTADETVDRAVLEALRRWRFRPTYVGYQMPMASIIEVRLTLIVN